MVIGKKMENNFAIIKNNTVVNVVKSTPEFAKEQGWTLLTGGAWIGWGYVDGQFVPPPPLDYSSQNKEIATSLLQQTDWTCTVDIADPQYSNPYLTNQSTFLAFRSQVRAIAVNPPTTLAVFPEQPQAVWS
jgi:hypothetical protein